VAATCITAELAPPEAGELMTPAVVCLPGENETGGAIIGAGGRGRLR